AAQSSCHQTVTLLTLNSRAQFERLAPLMGVGIENGHRLGQETTTLAFRVAARRKLASSHLLLSTKKAPITAPDASLIGSYPARRFWGALRDDYELWRLARPFLAEAHEVVLGADLIRLLPKPKRR